MFVYTNIKRTFLMAAALFFLNEKRAARLFPLKLFLKIEVYFQLLGTVPLPKFRMPQKLLLQLFLHRNVWIFSLSNIPLSPKLKEFCLSFLQSPCRNGNSFAETVICLMFRWQPKVHKPPVSHFFQQSRRQFPFYLLQVLQSYRTAENLFRFFCQGRKTS